MSENTFNDLELDSSYEMEGGKVNDENTSPNQNKKLLRLPLARVKHMMKKDPDCGLISQDALVLITKATEMFIEYMGKESYNQIVTSKRKTILKRDVDAVINCIPQLCFLEGALE